jgi:hypothetical protein
MYALAQRLDALTAALTAAPPPAGGPARRIQSDYGPSGDRQKGGKKGGRKVASKAGAARYGLPIGTPLDGTHSKKKADAKTKQSYNTFMAASTPADQRKAASWMSTGDLKRAGEALFSFDSKNERDQSARIALVKELADRGIDPHSLGYKGGAVVLNPNPKQDPVEKAAQQKKTAAERAKKAAQTAQQRAKNKAESDARRKVLDTERARKQSVKAQQDEEDLKFRRQAGQALARGLATDAELRDAWRRRRQAQPTG